MMSFKRAKNTLLLRLVNFRTRGWLVCLSALLFIFAVPKLLAEEYDARCTATNDVKPICGLQRPEDLTVMLGEKLLLVSEYGSLDGSISGYLSSYRIHDGHIQRLFPNQQDKAKTDDSNKEWGAENCPGPPGNEFSPHGIYHNTLIAPNRLVVVNHGGREAIEFFEVTLTDGGLDMRLDWRGCVIAPQGAWFNDVISLPDGGVIASHMMERGLDHDQLTALELSKEATGYLLQWSHKSGWKKVKNSAGALPNGIEISPDGGVLFINYYFGDKVVALERKSGKRLWQSDVDGPDNSSWAANGTLLVASHKEDLAAVSHCAGSTEAYCKLKYAIVSLEPKTAKKTVLLTGGGTPFGGATVGVQVGDDLFLGAFAGNRMAKRLIRRAAPQE